MHRTNHQKMIDKLLLMAIEVDELIDDLAPLFEEYSTLVASTLEEGIEQGDLSMGEIGFLLQADTFICALSSLEMQVKFFYSSTDTGKFFWGKLSEIKARRQELEERDWDEN